MGNRLQSAAGQSVHLGGIVHNVTQAVEVSALIEFLLSLTDGSRHPEAEARPLINLNYSHSQSSLNHLKPRVLSL